MNIIESHVRTPTGREADQLAIYKHGQGVEHGTTKNNYSYM